MNPGISKGFLRDLRVRFDWLFPFLLTLLPLIILHWNGREDRSRFETERNRRILASCQAQARRFEAMSDPKFWVEEARRRIKLAVEAYRFSDA